MDGNKVIRPILNRALIKVFQGIECVSRGCVLMAKKRSALAFLEPSEEYRSWW